MLLFMIVGVYSGVGMEAHVKVASNVNVLIIAHHLIERGFASSIINK